MTPSAMPRAPVGRRPPAPAWLRARRPCAIAWWPLDAAWARRPAAPRRRSSTDVRAVVAELVAALEAGDGPRGHARRAAVDGGWRVDAWVKTGILLGFRLPGMTEYRDGPIMAARDKSAYGAARPAR